MQCAPPVENELYIAVACHGLHWKTRAFYRQSLIGLLPKIKSIEDAQAAHLNLQNHFSLQSDAKGELKPRLAVVQTVSVIQNASDFTQI